jgi:hypothetical protein
MTTLDVLQNLGIFSLLVAGVAWLARALTKQVLDRDIEKFKSDLERDAITYKIKYERLHAERVEVIKDVYKKIVGAHESLRSLINPLQGAGEPTEDEKAKKASQANIELIEYYQENRIFFDEELATEIDALRLGLREAWGKFHNSRTARKDGDYKEARNEWLDAWEKIDEEVPKVKGHLEEKFRTILGIENQ